MSNNKENRGISKIKLILFLIIAVLAFCGFLFLRMKWKIFRASANFGLYITLIVIAIILIAFLVIKSKINTARRVRAAEIETETALIEGTTEEVEEESK